MIYYVNSCYFLPPLAMVINMIISLVSDKKNYGRENKFGVSVTWNWNILCVLGDNFRYSRLATLFADFNEFKVPYNTKLYFERRAELPVTHKTKLFCNKLPLGLVNTVYSTVHGKLSFMEGNRRQLALERFALSRKKELREAT